MAHISTYKELRVYQAAMAAAMRIFEVTKNFPLRKDIRSSIRFGAHRGPFAQTLEKRGESDGTAFTSSAN